MTTENGLVATRMGDILNFEVASKEWKWRIKVKKKNILKWTIKWIDLKELTGF